MWRFADDGKRKTSSIVNSPSSTRLLAHLRLPAELVGQEVEKRVATGHGLSLFDGCCPFAMTPICSG
jgi:hypothetical protein